MKRPTQKIRYSITIQRYNETTGEEEEENGYWASAKLIKQIESILKDNRYRVNSVVLKKPKYIKEKAKDEKFYKMVEALQRIDMAWLKQVEQ